MVTGEGGDGLELLVAAHVRESLRKRYLDILELRLRGGEVPSLHRVSRSADASLRPSVLKVATGEVAAWLETAGFGKYAVRVAGTTPALRTAQNALRPGDLLLSVLAVLPLGLVAAVWLVPCYVIILGVTAVATTWAACSWAPP